MIFITFIRLKLHMVLDSQVSLHSTIFIMIVRKKLTEDMR